MPEQPPNAAPIVRPHLVPRLVSGNLWMLYHVHFEQLLDDFGWFRSRRDAEAKIAELQSVAMPTRFVSLALDPDAVN